MAPVRQKTSEDLWLCTSAIFTFMSKYYGMMLFDYFV